MQVGHPTEGAASGAMQVGNPTELAASGARQVGHPTERASIGAMHDCSVCHQTEVADGEAMLVGHFLIFPWIRECRPGFYI